MTDAEKREKVIRGLELCAYDPDPGQELKEIRSCPECPYYRAGCSPQLIRDALALLREQEPRVMTLDEVRRNHEWAVWIECNSSKTQNIGQYSGKVSWYNKRLSDWERFLTIGSDEYLFRESDGYGKTWRCWTARPTEEQRKAAKWDE